MTGQSRFTQCVRARIARPGWFDIAVRARLLGTRRSRTRTRTGSDGGGLHVTNGDSTDLRGTRLAHRVLAWFDVLQEGPVPAVPDEEFRRIRAAHLTNADPAGARELSRTGSGNETRLSMPTATAPTCCGSKPICMTSCRSCRSSPASPTALPAEAVTPSWVLRPGGREGPPRPGTSFRRHAPRRCRNVRERGRESRCRPAGGIPARAGRR